MQVFEHINLWQLQAVAIDLVIILLLFVSLRFIKGIVSNVHTMDEIARRDNFAFGISFSGGIAALAIMLTGAAAGSFADTLWQEVQLMTFSGVFGITLILLGRWFQDKWVLPKVDLHQQISTDNLAAALVDVGNVLAVGIVIRGAMLWVETEGWLAYPVILVSFVSSQIVLMLAAKYRIHLFKSKNPTDNCLQKAIEEKNYALALRYAGYLIGTSLSITAASGFIAYDPVNPWLAVIIWAGVALVVSLLFAIIQLTAMRLILPGVDISDEVDQQHNVGVAAIEVAISLAIGLVFITLFV